ncbi:MAG TPA: ABC transporter substrate-binding protein [Chloroflexota bacterium]|nr:ABC transporter substrate-binding protein [Chloroflexota bacterium]
METSDARRNRVTGEPRPAPAMTRRRLVGRFAAAGGAIALTAAATACGAGAQESAPSVDAKPVELETWHTHTVPSVSFEGFQAVLDDYKKLRPNTSFKLTFIAGSSASMAGGYNDKITSAIAAGTPPDVLHMNRPPEFGEAGLLTELGQYIKKDKTFNAGDFFEGPWARCTFFDRVWGIPVICDNRAIWINKAAYVEAGLDPSKPPKTWNEMEQAAQKLTKTGPGGLERVGFLPVDVGNADLYSWIYANGGDIVTVTPDKADIGFNKPAAVEAADWLVRMFDRVGGYDNWAAFKKNFQGQAQDPFFQKQLAMKRDGSFFLSTVRQYSPQTEYILAPEPYGPSGKGPATLVGGYNWSISRGAKNAEAGWNFLSWFSQKDPATKYAAPQGVMPGRKSAANTDYVTKNPDIKFFFEALKYSKPFPTAPWTQFMWDNVNVEAQNAIIRRQKTPKVALDDAAQKVQLEIDKWLRENRDRNKK